MNWLTHIVSDPEILSGKPVVKGTRLAVDFLLGLMAEGWTKQQVLENYPHLSKEALQAVYSFSAECMREDALYATDTRQAV